MRLTLDANEEVSAGNDGSGCDSLLKAACLKICSILQRGSWSASRYLSNHISGLYSGLLNCHLHMGLCIVLPTWVAVRATESGRLPSSSRDKLFTLLYGKHKMAGASIAFAQRRQWEPTLYEVSRFPEGRCMLDQP